MIDSAADPSLLAHINIAMKWFKDLLVHNLTPQVCAQFEKSFQSHCLKKMTGHWYPSMPQKGQAFRSISHDFFGRPDPLFLAISEELKVDIISSIPKYLVSCMMWIDPNSIVVKSYWSYSAKHTEEILFPIPGQNINPYQQKTQIQSKNLQKKVNQNVLDSSVKQAVPKSSLNKAEALLWKQFCGGQMNSDSNNNNIEPNRIYA